jgi:hypothetical protein
MRIETDCMFLVIYIVYHFFRQFILLFAVYSSSVRLLSFVEGEKQTEDRDYTEEKSTATWAYNIFPSTLWALLSASQPM